jgi:hypothetical protein
VENSVKIAGREFQISSQSVTAQQDDYVLGHLRAAGVVDVAGDGDFDTKRIPRQRYDDLLTAIYLSGRKYQILAGVLAEVGKKWTRDEAERNAAVFSQVADLADKKTMQTAIVKFVIGFLTSLRHDAGSQADLGISASSPQ